MTITVENYYQPGWRDQTHTCAACEWHGTSRQMEMELHDEQTEYSCPGCEHPLLIVLHPSLQQLKDAAAQGHAEALEQLAILEAAPRPD
ncbi:MAG: hypothetical protein ACOH1V_04705 [Stenotrophomonas sp.]